MSKSKKTVNQKKASKTKEMESYISSLEAKERKRNYQENFLLCLLLFIGISGLSFVLANNFGIESHGDYEEIPREEKPLTGLFTYDKSTKLYNVSKQKKKKKKSATCIVGSENNILTIYPQYPEVGDVLTIINQDYDDNVTYQFDPGTGEALLQINRRSFEYKYHVAREYATTLHMEKDGEKCLYRKTILVENPTSDASNSGSAYN